MKNRRNELFGESQQGILNPVSDIRSEIKEMIQSVSWRQAVATVLVLGILGWAWYRYVSWNDDKLRKEFGHEAKSAHFQQ